METTRIMQELRRRRVAVGICLIVSLLVGGLIAYQITPGLPPQIKSREKQVGQASSRLLVDTPASMVADLNPEGAGALLTHAQLLGDLIASAPLRNEIAHAAGIQVRNLAIVPPTIAAPVGTQVSRVVAPPAAASTITVTVDPALPIISVDVQSPSRALATKLASTTFAVLGTYERTVAQEQGITTGRQPVLRSLGITSSIATEGPSRLTALAVTLALFGLSCYLILVVRGVKRRSEVSHTTLASSVSSPVMPRPQELAQSLFVPPPSASAPVPTFTTARRRTSTSGRGARTPTDTQVNQDGGAASSNGVVPEVEHG